MSDEKIKALETRIEQLEQQLQDSRGGISRRAALAGLAGAAGLGTLAGDRARAQAGSGTFGFPDAPLEQVYAENFGSESVPVENAWFDEMNIADAQIDAGQVDNLDVGAFDFSDETVEFESVSTGESRTESRSITLNVPSDYDTISDAVDELQDIRPSPGLSFDVNVETGHEILEGVEVAQKDLRHVTVKSDDDIIMVSNSFDDEVVLDVRYNATGPLWDLSMDIDGNAGRGVRAIFLSRLRLGDGVEILNAEERNIVVAQSSFVQGRGVVATGAGEHNIALGNNSFGSFRSGSDFSDAGEHCVRCANSILALDQGVCNKSGSTAVDVTSQSRVEAPQLTVEDAGHHGVRVSRGSQANLREAKIDSPDTHAVRVSGDAICNLNGAEVTGSGSGGWGYGVKVLGASANVSSATITGTVDDRDDLRVRDGGIVRTNGTETTSSSSGEVHQDDVNIPINSLEGEGVIFAESPEGT